MNKVSNRRIRETLFRANECLRGGPSINARETKEIMLAIDTLLDDLLEADDE